MGTFFKYIMSKTKSHHRMKKVLKKDNMIEITKQNGLLVEGIDTSQASLQTW